MIHAAVDQLLGDADPLTSVRQLDDLIDKAVPYLRAARRKAIYDAKTKGTGMSWPALADALGMRENTVRRLVARHCEETGAPWPTRSGTDHSRPKHFLVWL